MKIVLVTDTWNNVNGVVTTLRKVVEELTNKYHEVYVIEPSMFKTVSVPGYLEVQLSLNLWKVFDILKKIKPDAIHIATEGPLGLAARFYCKSKGFKYNTSYHTKFPEYLKIHYGIPLCVGYKLMKMFHKYSEKVLVTTDTMKNELASKGFKNLVTWSRGVDRKTFNPSYRKQQEQKILLCVSRVSKEKGLDDFCSLKTSARKILVGNGPYLKELKAKYQDVEYVGYKHGKELAEYYANADVFVFPSRSDTFGVVMLESLACGTPVAAYPVTGPIDVLNEENGSLDEDLSAAIERCFLLNRKTVEMSCTAFSWERAAQTFEENLSKIEYT